MTEEEITQEHLSDETEETDELQDELAAAFSNGAQIEVGDAPQPAVEKLRPICTLADQSYNQILGLIRDMRSAESVLEQFHAGKAGIGSADVEQAKTKFETAKQSYLQFGNQINEGIKPVYQLAKTYVNDILVQTLYQTYLAKLLASLETRNPLQPYVEQLALYGFEFEREELIPTELEEQRKLTSDDLSKERLELIEVHIKRLESRYTKRLLANRMRNGENPRKVIRVLSTLVRRDPEDINTYLWLASLLSEELKRSKDQNKRITIRDDILDYCKRAFAKIDDYLNLQGIENLNERDRKRSEYIKSITAIRKPLVAH